MLISDSDRYDTVYRYPGYRYVKQIQKNLTKWEIVFKLTVYVLEDWIRIRVI
jgi:hypothetical protein